MDNRTINNALEFFGWAALAVFIIGILNIIIVAARAIAWITS